MGWICIFSIALDAEYLSYEKSIATFAVTFFWLYYFSLSQCVLPAALLKA